MNLVGRTLAHYRIDRLLGTGGMGEVYAAEDTKLRRPVAIKVLRSDLAADPTRRGRFEREALAVAALNHPNIVTIHAVEEADGIPFLVMELVDGQGLGELIPPDGFTVERFLEFALPLAEAAAAAHAKGITHRDLKPGNVMVDDAGRVKVLDFGLAKAFETAAGADPGGTLATAAGGETAEGSVLGTAHYMAPEQAEGRPVDARTDVFALGVVFYEMLTGRRPFDGDTSISVISSVLKDTPSPVHEVKSMLPRHVGRIINRCLAKDPARRYQSASDLHAELVSFKEEIDSGEYATSEHPTMTPQDQDAMTRRLEFQQSRRPSRNYAWMAGGMVVAAVVVTVILSLLFGGEDDAADTARAVGGPVGVIGFENLADPADSDQLGRMLTGLVTTYLSETGGVEVVSFSAVTAAQREVTGGAGFDPSRAADIARKAGAGAMVVGQISRLGDRISLTAEVVDVGRGTTLGSMSYQASSDDEFFDLAADMARDVRGKLADGAAPAGGATSDLDLAGALTDDPVAYRHYVAGEIALHQRRWDATVENMDRALAADPTFALAYYRKAMAIWWIGEHDPALAVLEAGAPHAARLPDRWEGMYRALTLYLENREDEVHDLLLDLTRRFPDLPDAWYLLGEVYTHSPAYSDAVRALECFETAYEADPNYHILLFHLVQFLVRAGEVDRAQAVVEHFRSTAPDDPALIDSEIGVLAVQGRYREAIARAEQARSSGRLETPTRLVNLYMVTGQPERALEFGREAAPEERAFNRGLLESILGMVRVTLGEHEAGLVDMRAALELIRDDADLGLVTGSYTISYVDLLEFIGRSDEALTAARQLVEGIPDLDRAHLTLVRLLCATDRLDEAEQALARLDALARKTGSAGVAYNAALGRGELETARGNGEAALRSLETARRSPHIVRSLSREFSLEGRARLTDDDPAGAARAFAAIRDPLSTGSFVSTGIWARSFYHEAQALDAAGDYDAARRAYREFLDVWAPTDAPFPRRAEAADRLASLERGN